MSYVSDAPYLPDIRETQCVLLGYVCNDKVVEYKPLDAGQPARQDRRVEAEQRIEPFLDFVAGAVPDRRFQLDFAERAGFRECFDDGFFGGGEAMTTGRASVLVGFCLPLLLLLLQLGRSLLFRASHPRGGGASAAT